MPKAIIIYHSKSGHTKKMAEAIAEGIAETKVSVIVVDVNKAKVDDLLSSDAIVIGSPCYYGTMSGEIKSFIDSSVKFHGKLTGKVGGAFCSAGILGGGSETAVVDILRALLIHGMIVRGCEKISHYGPVAIGSPNDTSIKECKTYGKMLGELTIKLQ